VRIKTANADALKAINDFLRFQIEDHHTGDTTDISALYWARICGSDRLAFNAWAIEVSVPG
jgi:hypothetical protein